ncbi:MAG: DNA repair protein RadA, partial [Peptococcaceae bacterium]|nr:DNA repair protein RadA [Peptococcaceae bacterium]
GEIRGVSHIEQRLKEAEKFGYDRILIPEVNCKRLQIKNRNIHAVRNVEQILEFLY